MRRQRARPGPPPGIVPACGITRETLRPSRAPAWFVDAGIGAVLLAPVWRTHDKQFSTVFNFGEHLALGRCFGKDCAYELALRAEHYSNANLRRPNPGQNYVQLRYTRRLD